MSAEKAFTKENLDRYLKELAKEFRKQNGTRMPVEITLIGGAAVLINYGFREMTYDMDAIIDSSSVMKEVINTVGHRLDLPYGWLNTDFMNTASYTPKLVQYSKYYKTFSNIVQVRTITAEHLVAMKLMAGRQYKNDLSDIIGILIEQDARGDAFTLDRIKAAIIDLYDDYARIPEKSRNFIEAVFCKEDLKEFFRQCRELEIENQEVFVQIHQDYPGLINKNNLDDVLEAARRKKNQR